MVLRDQVGPKVPETVSLPGVCTQRGCFSQDVLYPFLTSLLKSSVEFREEGEGSGPGLSWYALGGGSGPGQRCSWEGFQGLSASRKRHHHRGKCAPEGQDRSVPPGTLRPRTRGFRYPHRDQQRSEDGRGFLSPSLTFPSGMLEELGEERFCSPFWGFVFLFGRGTWSSSASMERYGQDFRGFFPFSSLGRESFPLSRWWTSLFTTSGLTVRSLPSLRISFPALPQEVSVASSRRNASRKESMCRFVSHPVEESRRWVYSRVFLFR